ncbi:MAG: hypothetical protein HUK00_04730 [Bacteroidaceae bacterium]|nr:hypothetical protein [Bacteroidaceae bacterium]
MNTHYINNNCARRKGYESPATQWARLEMGMMIATSQPKKGDSVDEKMSATNADQGAANGGNAFNISWETGN